MPLKEPAEFVSPGAIARTVGIDMKTLNKHFRTELAEGKATVVAAIGASVVKAALAGNLFAARYWLSCFGGPQWRVTEDRRIGGLPDTPPIPVGLDAKVVVYLPDNGRAAHKPGNDL